MILLSSNQILNECLCRDRFNKFARISLLKKKNCDYNSSDRDQIRRAYLQKKKKKKKKITYQPVTKRNIQCFQKKTNIIFYFLSNVNKKLKRWNYVGD